MAANATAAERAAMSDEGYVHEPESDEQPRSEYDVVAAHAHEREFDWRGWVLVGVIVVAFLIVPATILALPHAGGVLATFGLTWRDTFLVLPLAPALALGLAAIWATARA